MPIHSETAARLVKAVLKGTARDLAALLAACGVDDPANSPQVRSLVKHWTETMNGHSILEALEFLFIGAVAVIGELEKDAAEEARDRTPAMVPEMAAH